MTPEQILVDTRLAGQVLRYHTWPTIHKQTVAEHTWQLLRIYLAVCEGSFNQVVMRHIIMHDVGEITTGDLPYPIKHNNPPLKEIMDGLEFAAVDTQMVYWNIEQPVSLQSEDKKLVKQIEMMEMAEFGMNEITLGNHYGWPIADRCLGYVYRQPINSKFIKYVQTRIEHFFMPASLAEISVKNPWWHPPVWENQNRLSKVAE